MVFPKLRQCAEPQDSWGWAMEFAVGSTTSEVLHTLEEAREVEEIASSEWDPDNNVRQLLGPHRKGKL